MAMNCATPRPRSLKDVWVGDWAVGQGSDSLWYHGHQTGSCCGDVVNREWMGSACSIRSCNKVTFLNPGNSGFVNNFNNKPVYTGCIRDAQDPGATPLGSLKLLSGSQIFSSASCLDFGTCLSSTWTSRYRYYITSRSWRRRSCRKLYEPRMNLYEPRMNLYEPRMNLYEPRMNLYEPRMNLYEPRINIYEPRMNLFEPRMNLYEPRMNLYEPRMNLYEPRMNLYEPGMNPYDPGMNLFEPRMNPYEPRMNPYDPGMNLFEPRMNPYEPGMNLYEPGMNIYEPRMNIYEPGMNPYDPCMNLYEPGMNLYACMFRHEAELATPRAAWSGAVLPSFRTIDICVLTHIWYS